MSPGYSTRETRETARELKFLVTPDKAARILEWSQDRLAPDPYATDSSGEYQITTLYFDTAHFDVYHRRGSFKRSKYRIRRYGSADVAFLERKLRTATMLTKRRTVALVDSLPALLNGHADSNWPGHWFHQRLRVRRLFPACQVSYRRTARVGMATYGPMRLTIDHELHAQHASRLEFSARPGAPVLESQAIVELKYLTEMPAIFKDVVEEFALDIQPISKYRLSIEALRHGNAATRPNDAPYAKKESGAARERNFGNYEFCLAAV